MEQNKKRKAKQIICALMNVVVLVFLDQYTKALAIEHLKYQEPYVLIQDVFEFRYLENIGAAFSSMLGKTTFLLIFTGIIALGIAVAYFLTPTTKRWTFFRVLLIGIFAGGIGNFIDRARLGYVVDFIYFKAIHFPTFNVADIYVTVAVFLLFIAIMWVYKESDWEEYQEKLPQGIKKMVVKEKKDVSENTNGTKQ